ncbi:MAG: RcpC/CpaB family pilus assembly protein [Dehalococcoidia bacterium]|nr:RcpC/CpaB family pilus assembly protein [Dehalococcoidia bacterium]
MSALPGVRRRANVALPFRVDRRMLAGVLLVVVSLAGGLLLWRSATDTTPILVAARDIPPGHVIQRDDLRIGEARLDGSLASMALTEADLETAVGRTTSTTIHAGEMMVHPDLASGPVLGADEVAVTIPVAADSIYPGLRPTDEVSLLATSNAGKPESKTVTLLERATVFAIGLERRVIRSSASDNPNDGATVANITIAVPRSQAEAVAHAVANATITVVLLAPQETTLQP